MPRLPRVSEPADSRNCSSPAENAESSDAVVATPDNDARAHRLAASAEAD